MIVFENLTKQFAGRAVPALDSVSFELRDGEVLGLVGLNGAGKTTTIRLAAGVSLPTHGRVTIDGRDVVREKRQASTHLGWVPESFPIEPGARALPQLEYYAGFHGLHGPSSRERCRALLAQVGLAEVENERLRTFSQGMRKRFSLASAMVSDPPNLLLDEVMNGLDPEGLAFVRGWLRELRDQRRAVLLSSHQLAELQPLADRIAFIHRGRLLRTISRGELESASETTLRIQMDRVDPSVLEYLESVGAPRVEGTTVYLAQPRADAATISTELVHRGYRVGELRVESASLEAYFLRLIEAAG